jgi:hypothetical protein
MRRVSIEIPKQSPRDGGDCFVAFWAPCNDGLGDLEKINRPSRLRRAIGLTRVVCQLAKLRPTIHQIVIIIIIVIIGEVDSVLHGACII